MQQGFGKRIAIEMKKRGTGPRLWAVANGFSRRTVNDLLHRGLGLKRGGPATQKIIEKLREDEYIDENNQLIEQERQAI